MKIVKENVGSKQNIMERTIAPAFRQGHYPPLTFNTNICSAPACSTYETKQDLLRRDPIVAPIYLIKKQNKTDILVFATKETPAPNWFALGLARLGGRQGAAVAVRSESMLLIYSTRLAAIATGFEPIQTELPVAAASDSVEV